MGLFEQMDKAWSVYTRSMERLTGDPGGPVVLQVARVLRPLDVLSGSTPFDLYSKTILGDTMPIWHPTYVESGGVTVSSGYYDFLISLNAAVLDTASEGDRKELKKAFDAAEKAREAFEKRVGEIDAKWKKEKAEDPALFRDEWERRAGYDTEMAMLRQSLDDAMGRYLVQANRNPNVLRVARAFGLYNAPNAQLRLPESRDLAGEDQKDSWGRFYKTFVDGDFTRFRDMDFNQVVDFSEGSESSRNYESRWSGSASVGFSFFRIGAEASGGTITSHLEQSATRVRIEFKNLAAFPVRRSTWFQGGLIRQYLKTVDAQAAWGKAGYLNLIPTSFVCGRGPKLTLSVSNTVRDEFHNWHQVSGSAGFAFGPWTIGGGAGSSSRTDQVDVRFADGTITLEDRSNTIYAVACVSERPLDYVSGSDFVPLEAEAVHALYADAAREEAERDAAALRAPFRTLKETVTPDLLLAS